MSGSPSDTRLVADVGGTNTRMAVYDHAQGRLRALHSYTNRDFAEFEAVVDDWLRRLDEPRPATACIAVAAPPAGDRVRMTNVNWSFSCRALASRFGLQQVVWINDFVSNAYALPHLGAADSEPLQAGRESLGGHSDRLAVVGPGTGLGGATLDSGPRGYRAWACEPGHMGLSPADEEELALFRLLLARQPDIYGELLVSGPGLVRLHTALAQLRDQPAVAASPEEISARAVAGDPLCLATLQRFCALLGSLCGDFVLASGSYGGLYLAGGIVPRILPLLRQSDFLARFAAKGAMRSHLAAVPVYAITAAHPGLLGAAHAPLE